jgi:ribose 5-phosphate isomerase
MRPLPALRNLIYHVSARTADDAYRLERRLAGIAGVTEAVVIVEEGVAYLKVDARRIDEPALRQALVSA